MDLNGQTAPESTHGLFGPSPSEMKVDKRRSAIELSHAPGSSMDVSGSGSTSLRSHSVYGALHASSHGNQHHHRFSSPVQPPATSLLQSTRSALHTVDEERPIHVQQQQHGMGRKHDAYDLDDDTPTSREDAVAEAEAKLNGYSKPASQDNNAAWHAFSRESQYARLSRQQHPSMPSLHQQQHQQQQQHQHQQPQTQDDDAAALERKNRRLSEPNARIYYRYSDLVTDRQQQDRRSHQPSPPNRRVSLQLDSRQNPRPALFLDTNDANRRSRNLNNDWRASSSRRSSGYGFVPLTPSRMSFNRDDNTVQQQLQQRRALFTAHLPFSAVAPHLKSYQLVSGLLRVNKRNRSDAYVFCEGFNADIYICGSRDRNRALEGDLVAVRLVEVDRVMREKMEKEEAKLARNNGQPIVRKPDEEDEKEIIFGGEDDVDQVKPKYCGVVVAILERVQNQVFSGTLGLMRPSNKRQNQQNPKRDQQEDDRDNSPRIVWFKPTDKRVPLIAIPVEQAPEGFVDNCKAFEKTLFLGSIKRWPITSLHPFGVLESQIGLVDTLSVQFRAILADNKFLMDEFSPQIKDQVPALPWSPPAEALTTRRDLRAIPCFTVDNPIANDQDVALSFEKLGTDAYQVALHVADLTAFVEPKSPMDKEARDRGCGIVLEHSVPLWPDELTKNCTNLVPDRDRFAFSVIWKFSSEHQVIDTWVGKTVVRSRALLSPRDLQAILDSDEDSQGMDGSAGAVMDDEARQKRDIKQLYALAQHLRAKRKESGALFINSEALDVQMQDGQPVKVTRVAPLPSTAILEEFSILANIGVAQTISRGFPETALLQSQAPPNERKLQELAKYLDSLGYMIDVSSAKAMQASVEAIDNADARNVITTLILKAMRPIKFYCTGAYDISRYHHYSLNVPLYTEFTCPTRKYACVIVHRLLQAALAGERRFYLEEEYVQKIAQHCNAREQSLLNAKEQGHHLLLSKYLTLSNHTSTTHDAIVVGVQKQAFDVIVPTLGLERRIHVINLPLRTSHYSTMEGVLNLFWLPGVPTSNAIVEQTDREDDDDDDFHGMLDSSSSSSSSNSSGGSHGDRGGGDDVHKLTDHAISQLSVSDKRSSMTNSSSTSASAQGGSQDNVTSPPASAGQRRRPRSMSLRAINGESSDSQQLCTIPQEARSVIRPFDFIRVVITAEATRNPPLIRVLAANPFISSSTT